MRGKITAYHFVGIFPTKWVWEYLLIIDCKRIIVLKMAVRDGLM